MDNFKINFNCIILSYNPKDELTYILSSDKTEIKPISFFLSKDNLNNYNSYIVNLVKDLFLVQMEEFEINPQLIKFHDSHIDENKEIINCILGFFVTFTDKIKDNTTWIHYSPESNNKYSQTILDVIRNIQ